MRALSGGLLLACAILAAASAGCGYRVRSDGRPLGMEIQSLAIPMMTSTSSSLAFEPDFTRVIREEFIRNARVPIRPGELAHMVLVGHVRDIRTEAVTYDLDRRRVGGEERIYSTTSSRRLMVELDARLVDRESGETVWSEAGLFEEERFEVSADPLFTRENQRRALRRIAENLAKRVYLKTMERF